MAADALSLFFFGVFWWLANQLKVHYRHLLDERRRNHTKNYILLIKPVSFKRVSEHSEIGKTLPYLLVFPKMCLFLYMLHSVYPYENYLRYYMW